MSDRHVIFGAGQVGSALARHLASAGHPVRVVRKRSIAAGSGIEVVGGDLGDAAFVRAQAEGAAVLYHAANVAYDSALWRRLLPGWTDNLLTAARATGARLVVLDNLYAFGDGGGQPFVEEMPVAPRSKKGTVRAAIARRLREAQRAGEMRVVVARASDFWGPGATNSYLGDQFWPAALTGKTVRAPLPVGTLHTYHYVPDVVSGLAALGCAGHDVDGLEWMLPCLPPIELRRLVDRLGTELGQPIRLIEVPPLLLSALGLFIPILRELNEMRYQWAERFEVDDARFRARFPAVPPTPMDEAIGATVAWARRHYGRGV